MAGRRIFECIELGLRSGKLILHSDNTIMNML